MFLFKEMGVYKNPKIVFNIKDIKSILTGNSISSLVRNILLI